MMKFFSAILLFLAVAVCAAPVKKTAPYTAGSAKVVGAVESKAAFSGDRLFAVLDSVGGAGTWMEWDVNGIKDPSLMDVLDPMLKGANKPEMVWVVTERSKPLVAVLLPKGSGEVILFYELSSLNAKPEPLSINPVLSPDVVLRDYRQISETEYVHRDKENLKVKLTPRGMRFTYEKKGEEPLRMESDYVTKTFAEKQSILRDYEDYFKYEYSLMLRAFVQSTRSIFNWQAWHWYMPEWNAKFLMSRRELDAILVRGVAPSMFTLFKAKTVRGETVEFRCNGNGFWELEVIGLE
ncbi:MAG: hypothetical protein IKO21_09450 [Fibrobacter sp.]|nr:hypothetical protein [Fibrobacter sp.]